jgi:hypothetical protein
MSDITVRLRARYQYSGIVDPICQEAAAEIDRLRTEQVEVCEAIKDILRRSGLTVLADEIVKLHALVNAKLMGSDRRAV